MMKMAEKLSIAILSIGLIFNLGPLVWMLVSALFESDPKTGVWQLTLENFSTVLSAGNILRWSLNSFFVAGSVTLSQIVFNSLAAYGFSVGRFKGRNFLFMVMLAAMMVPGQIVMLPLFLFMARWNLVNTLWSVILPVLSAPFGVYMVRQYMDSIPIQLAEAARIDGANELTIFRKIYFPLSLPILATSGILIFITEWNAFLWPLITLNNEKFYTLTVGLATMQEQQVTDYGLLMAGATLSAIPMVGIFMFFSKYMLEGMRKGAIQ